MLEPDARKRARPALGGRARQCAGPGLSGGVGATVDTLVEAERQFRKFDGFSDLAKLAVTLERELTSPQPNRVHDREAAIVATASYQTRTATANFHAGRDIC